MITMRTDSADLIKTLNYDLSGYTSDLTKLMVLAGEIKVGNHLEKPVIRSNRRTVIPQRRKGSASAIDTIKA